MTRTPLVRHGIDEFLPDGRHTVGTVYSEMLLQISHDYPGLPDPRTLTLDEIRFFYNGLRSSLHKATKRRER